MIRFRDVLKDRNFLFLWLAQVISNFGDRLNQMALVALIYQRSPGSAMALAKLISFTVIPVFLIGPIAGAWVDRLNRKHVMIISDVLRGILVLSIPLFIYLNQILVIYFIVFLTFSISRFFIPSKMAIIPELVSKDKLLVANTLSDTTHMIGNVLGLVVAGVIVNIRGIGAVGGFYIDAVTFFVSASLIAMIVQRGFIKEVRQDLKATGSALKSSIRKSIVSDIKDGLKYIAGYGKMRLIMSVFFLLLAGIGAISCVIIVFIQAAFGNATRDLGFLGMFLVGGLFLGTLFYGRFCQKADKKKVIFLSFVVSGIFIALFSIFVKEYPNIFTAGFIAALLGASISPIMISSNTITHETIPEEIRGRIFSSIEAVIHLAFLLFMFLAAYLSNYIDRFWILMGVGGVFSVCGIVGFLVWRFPLKGRTS
ncbi:MAG: MFS transporter [Candidatus Omnitrophica bacterium]|nr:MFS transporter [Candidatus Omnitrophota bacterium]